MIKVEVEEGERQTVKGIKKRKPIKKQLIGVAFLHWHNCKSGPFHHVPPHSKIPTPNTKTHMYTIAIQK